MNKYLPALLAASLLYLCSAGQAYTFRRYTPADGLAGEDVHTIMQDSYGFIWLGTGNGLSRFDGKTFKNFNYTEGLRDLAVVSIYEDRRHRFWVGTQKGIAEFKNGEFILHDNKAHEIFTVYSFSEDNDEGLLVLTSKGAFRYNDTIWVKTTLLAQHTSGECVEIVKTGQGLYLNYTDALFFKNKNGEILPVASDTTNGKDPFCNQVSLVKGKVYAAIRNQLYELQNERKKLLIDSIPSDHFFYFSVDTGNTCWINIAGKGLYKYSLDKFAGQAVPVSEHDANMAGHIFIDKQHILWLTSYVGLVKLMPAIFEDITPVGELGVAKRLNAIPALDNEVIISGAGGLHLLKDNQLIPLPRPSSYNDDISYHNDIVEGAAKDNRNFTWMITRHRKILRWDGYRLQDFSHLLTPHTGDYIRNMTVNPVTNTVFICDDSSLLCGNEKKFSVFTDRLGKIFPQTTTVLFTHNGIGLVNVFLKGVYFVTRSNEIIKAPPELDIIDKGNYTYFFEDPEGWIWISNAGKGLVHFRVDENDYSVKDLQVFTTASGLPSNKIVDVCFDTEGNKWISCSNGLAVLKHSRLVAGGWEIFTIGKEQHITLATPPTMTADHAGNVWLASLDKLIRVDAKRLQLRKEEPAVLIEKVLLNMKETNWRTYTDSLYGYLQLPVSPHLGHDENTLGIQYSGISVYNPEYLEYSYQLDPVDKNWSNPSPNNYISLVKLAPGSYTFKVKARARGTAWSKSAVFSFAIHPPFWESWWFRLLVITMAAATIVWVYRNRIKKIQRNADIQQQLRELEMNALKAQMNPHFIYNALNSIQSLIADEKKSEAINYIGTFSRLLRQVLDYTENSVISLEKELETLKLYLQLESLRLNMDLHAEIVTSKELICENEKVPPLILQPFVENALWHGLSRKPGEKKLLVYISANGDKLNCCIEDNGVGRENAIAFKAKSTAPLYSSKGIDITIKRLLNFNNSIENPVIYEDLSDKDQNPAGTRVTIAIKRS